MTKKHGHMHHGKTSRDILNGEEVIESTGLKNGDVFLDAGCGDGYISLKASTVVGESGKVYALDVYPESIETVRNEIENKEIKNVVAVLADMTINIPLDKDSIDTVLMANVLHGFVESEEVDVVMNNILKIVKPGGTFAVVEFSKVPSKRGPPLEIRLSPSEVSEILEKYNFEVVDTHEIGEHHYILKGLKIP